jgi:hypothetical protein
VTKQHASLELEQWARFKLEDQILMVANEMNRARKLGSPDDRQRLLNTYARVLRLIELTAATKPRLTVIIELLRVKSLVAKLYSLPVFDLSTHNMVFRSLLLLTPKSAKQIKALGLLSAN